MSTSAAPSASLKAISSPERPPPRVGRAIRARPADNGSVVSGDSVLVVDGDALDRAVVSGALASAKLAAATASSGHEALTWLAAHVPSVAILDLAMPAPGGLALLRSLRDDPRTADVAIVVLAGPDDDVARALELGADDFVPKPLHPAELAARVRLQLRLRGCIDAERQIESLQTHAATEAELTKTKNFLERVIESSADSIVSADMAGLVLLYNRAAERVHGYAASEVVGKRNVRDLYAAGGAREVMRLIRSNEHGAPGRLEGYRTEVLASDGTPIPVLLSAALILEHGAPVGSVGIFTDLRDRLRMEARLSEAQEALRAREKQAIVAELAGAAAHELNQPLTSVMGYADIIRRRLGDESPVANAASVILQEAARMAEIVRKIGTITRYETKTYVGAAKIIDLDRASDDDPERTNG